LVAYGWWAAFGVVLAFVDLAVQRLPARLSYTAAGGLIVMLLLNALLTNDRHAWFRAVAGGLIATSAVALCALALPTFVHWGDVRYALAVGAAAAWTGWLALYVAAFLATLLGAVMGLGLLMTRRASLATHLAQGPFWYAGVLLAVMLVHV
jgi:leader peptidase (prepilin peptidase)/N-methyltransferase